MTPENNLPVLPPFPTNPTDLRMITKAQQACVIGPVCGNALQALVEQHGDMSAAQVAFVRQFMRDVLLMPEEEIRKCSQVTVCSTEGDCLLAKFGSVLQVKTLNQYKKNLPRDLRVDDFVPPCLAQLEQVLVTC